MELKKECEIDAEQEKKKIDLHTLNASSARRNVGHKMQSLTELSSGMPVIFSIRCITRLATGSS